MKTPEFEALLDQILGLSDPDDATADEVALIRERLAKRLDEARESTGPTRRVSAAEIAAYAGNSLNQEERNRLEAEMAASPALMAEVMDALAFLDDVEAHLETAPDDLEEPLSMPAARIGAAEIEALFRDGKGLSHEQQRQLFLNPQLRSLFAKCKQDYAVPLSVVRGASRPSGGVVEMQRQAAAASDGGVDQRSFDGGTAKIVKSRKREEMIIVFTLVGWERPPRALLLEGSDGELAHSDLPQPDRDGKFLLIKNMDKEADATFVRLLRDPTSSGTFLK